MKNKLCVCVLFLIPLSAHADDISQKICQMFLPSFSDQNILIYNNTFKKQFKESGEDKFEKKFSTYMKIVEAEMDKSIQGNCNAGKYPLMDLESCYSKCFSEGYKTLPDGLFGWNINETGHRRSFIANCSTACSAAYSALNTTASVVRRLETKTTPCAVDSTTIFQGKHAKPISDILNNTLPTADGSAISK